MGHARRELTLVLDGNMPWLLYSTTGVSTSYKMPELPDSEDVQDTPRSELR